MSEVSEPASYPIESVENAARVLLMLRTQPMVRVAEVAVELGIARSSAHRMLTTLQSQGLLRQNPGNRAYVPGSQLIQLGLAVTGAGDLRSEVRPVLELLGRETEETVHLIVLEGTTIVFLDGVEGRNVIRAAVRTGDRAPAHASAAGKVLLSGLTQDELRARYPGGRLHGGTVDAISTRRALENELETIRISGYAMNRGESELDLHAVAAPIRDARGDIRGAISISGPASRLTEGAMALHAQRLLEALERLGSSLS